MPKVNILYWNIENIGLGTNPGNGKYTLTAPEMRQFIGLLIKDVGASIVALNEIRSNLGSVLGPDMINVLGANWQCAASDQFVNSRLEQYLFLWDTNVVTTYLPFRSDFPNPAPPPQDLGFPNQVGSDRPPYLGYFQTTNGQKIAVAAFHGPSPGFWNAVRDGNQRLGSVTEFQTAGDSCVVMGDCNIQYSADVTVNNSYGWWAFTPLMGLGFTQRIPQPMLTSLIAYTGGFPTMTIQDAYNQPYDQVFMRTAVGYACDAGREELLVECADTKYLSNTLKDIQLKWEGHRPITYANVEEAFVPFRRYVSDHMPVVAEVTYP